MVRFQLFWPGLFQLIPYYKKYPMNKETGVGYWFFCWSIFQFCGYWSEKV